MAPHSSAEGLPRRAYLLVGYPRTGSSVLCRALAATGVLGVPQEYFWRLVEARHAEEMGRPAPTDADYRGYLEAALGYGTTANGVFGAKLFWGHAQDLVRRTGLTEDFCHLEAAQRLWAPFGPDLRLVFVQRDCLRAALSLWRAEVTGVWGLRPGERDAPPPPVADIWAISVAHAEMHAADIGWRNILASTPLPLLELSYESVTADISGAVRLIADFVDVTPPPETLRSPPYFRRQADATTESHLREWWDQTGGCDRCRPPRPLGHEG
ncbi:MAG TPA: Stf0 family sulfotransferase [Acidimicrobiales bacterium]|nr:Stf0 family sulfotransferase [Acidimicrobiales bacterium]